MTDELKALVKGELSAATGKERLVKVLEWLGLSSTSWYREPSHGKRGPKPRPVAPEKAAAIVEFARRHPQWGYQRIYYVMRRRSEQEASKEEVYKVMKSEGLLQKRKRVREAKLHQCAKLFELLPSRPDELWQSDVTWIHIPGHQWWYAVTVIDYYSRYLLACHLTPSQTTHDAIAALEKARQEAARSGGFSGRAPTLVTDNGGCFVSRRFHDYASERFHHVRIQYRTPTQLGLLERFHGTLKEEEVYWNLYNGPADARRSLAAYRECYNRIRPHWALWPVGGGDPLVPADVYLDGLAVTIPKWQGWALAAKEKLQQMKAEQQSPDGSGNLEISPEINLETQIKCINPYPAN